MARIAVVRCHILRDTRVRRQVDALIDSGHEVELFCLRDAGEPGVQRNGPLTVRRLPLSHAAGAGALRLLVEYATFFGMVTALLAIRHLRRRFDLVQVNSVPEALVFSAVLPKLTGARVLLDLQEPMPEFFQTRFRATAGHPAVRLIVALEQASIRFADSVITVTEPMRRAFVARGGAPSKIDVIMDGTDEKVFDPDRFDSADPAGEERFSLVSHGTIEPQYGIDTMIEAVGLLAEDIPGIQLQIIGRGSQRDSLVTMARERGLDDRVSFSDGFLPLDDLVKAIGEANVGVVAMKQDAFRDLTLAGKMFDFIAMRKPMAVARTRSVQETFGDGCFEAFTPGDPADLARAIRRLHADPGLAEAYADRASARTTPIRWTVQRDRYCKIVARVLA